MPTISGHAVHATTTGTGSRAVMIHCALARHESLLPLAAAIGGQVSLFDMPGHGRSADWDGQHDYQTLVTDSAAALCNGPTHVIGHSFGATAALRLAVEQPDLVHRLTLIEPVYFAAAKGTPEHAAHATAFRPFVSAMLAGDDVRAAEIFNDLWGATAWAAIPGRLQKYLVDRIHLIVASGAAIEEDALGITSPERLGTLGIPVTLIRGAATQPVIAAIQTRLLNRLPNAREIIVPDAGHMVPITHMADVSRAIRAAGPETG
ncbi:alpha/beta fold hydrolase [Yoonia sp. SS1-5]|uniref:Alpha/beta fold hydrolase n=1 Tax=Yoonia rhodophyticola TaxID=3137370 RepID=A0AAN0MKU7_9RHOB